jgi:geranylgeranyl pyrophosphate synthase
LHIHKTARLIAASLQMGAIICEYDLETQNKLNDFGIDLGLLFQIQDDLLDVYGMKGRDKAATDIAEGKVSIFVAHVNDVGTAEEKEKLNRILKKPREKTTNEDIQVALEIFDRTEAKAMAVGVIRAIQKSLHEDQTLKSVPELRNLLIELSEQFLEPVNGIL